MKQIINFFKDEDGAAIPEYALILGVIAAVAVVGLELIGTNSSERFDTIGTKIGTAGTSTTP
jgi:Flp pilus assembly pilin Flp